MSYEIRRDENQSILVMQLDLPMNEGTTAELGRQAEVELASFLRHAAVCDWIEDNLDIEDSDTLEVYKQSHAQASSQLISCLLSLTGLANNLGIDIMQEIWEMPWSV